VECREWSRDSDPNGISLGGTRSSAAVSLYKDSSRRFREDSKVFEEEGELQFTRFGLSGICIFNMTRHMRFSREEGESLDDFLVKADLFPDGDIREYISDRKKGAFSERPVSDLLCALLKKPLADYVIARSAGEAGAKKTVSELTAAETEAIASCVHALSFHPSSVKGWKEAQVTMGGVRLEEINEESSESKLAEGLYITGELADRDYPCGGFNLSNAWLTGMHAAEAIAEKYINK
jgi:predicted flavoprotein YhiN